MNKRVLNIGYWIFIGVLTIVLVQFAARKQGKRKCDKISIKVNKTYQKFFIDEDDVLSMMTEGKRKIIKGLSKQAINVKHLETLIKENAFVQSAMVSIDHTGNLEVTVEQNEPIARIFTPKTSFYIDQEGRKLPLSKKYTARVPVIVSKYQNVDKKNDFFASKEAESYIFLLNYIRNDRFWSKQITELDLDGKGELEMLMQVGKQRVEFGSPENLESKFFRLNVFVKKVLPAVGWNKYERVSLKYKDQIVCE